MAENNSQQIKPHDENSEIEKAHVEVAIKYYLTPKYMKWEELFFDSKNKLTFGNSTQSAIVAYDLDGNNPKAYNVASVMGSKNLRKVKDLRKRYWEKRGLTPGKLLDLYNNLMVERKDVNLLYSVADDMGVELPLYRSIINAKQGLLQQNNTQINIEGGVNFEQLSDDQLQQFIESKRLTLRSTSIAGGGEAIEAESVAVHPLPQEAVRSDSDT